MLKQTNLPRFFHWKSGAIATLLASLMLLCSGAITNAQAAAKVAMMPSYNQNPTYGNAALNQPIRVWGRVWSATAPFTYSLDPGDGSTPITGTVSATGSPEIGKDHTYTTSGNKTVTLTITEPGGVVTARSAVVRVLQAPTFDQEVNMAIEKGLLYLYRTKKPFGTTGVYWYATGNIFGMGASSTALMAFEENGHLPANDDEDDIYAETVRMGLQYLYTSGYAGYRSIYNHSDGIAMRSQDSDGDGKGALFWNNGDHSSYVNSLASMAVILSARNAAEAQATIISGGPFNGQSVYSVIVDVLDQFAFAQGDGGYRGSQVYDLFNAQQGRWDGSAQQWPSLLFLTLQERWSHPIPQWLIDNAVYGFQQVQNKNTGDVRYGGVGYSAWNSWVNPAKTGGMLVTYGLGNKLPGDSETDIGLAHIGRNWGAAPNWGGDSGGWAGEFYAMYGIKKGLSVQGITLINAPNSGGTRDWYQDMAGWLLGKTALIGNIGTGQRNSGFSFGQQANGAWYTSSLYPGQSLQAEGCTAHAILVLTKAITQPPPVAQIAAVSDKPLLTAFQVNGTSSYHLDPNGVIVSYAWDLDNDGQFDDATGSTATHPGYGVVGTYRIGLRVTDANGMEATASILVDIVDTDVPPVASAIPAALPIYIGKVGEPITLDASESYDPDTVSRGDVIIRYDWDLNGDGIFNDATATEPTIEVILNAAYVGQVGVRVTSETTTGLQKSATDFADIQVSANDLYIAGLSVANLVPGDSADIIVTVENDPTSSQSFPSAVLRLYTSNPLLGGAVQVGASSTLNLAPGAPVTVTIPVSGLNGAAEVFAFIDATKVIPEWDEVNNVAAVGVLNEAPTIACAGNQTVEATSANGATVQVSASFADNNGDPLEVTWTVGGQHYATHTLAGGSTSDSISVTLPLGSTQVTASVTDGLSDPVSCSSTITVVDTTAPQITCPADATLEYPADVSPANTGTASASDAAGAIGLSYVDAVTAQCGNTVTIVRTWTAVDAAGLTASCSQVIKVVDTTAPAIICPADATLEFPANTDPANTGSASATDANGVASISYSDVVTDSCGNTLTIARTWTATDLCGNTSSCTQVIKVVDTTAPVIICPADATLEFPADTTPGNTGLPSGSDASGQVTITFTDAVVADCGNTLTIARTWTATDACGNASSCTQVIKVIDTTAPALVVPASLTLEYPADTTPEATAYATATDVGGAVAVTYADETVAACGNTFTIARTWTAVDACGNSSSGVQTITVVDTTAPVITSTARDFLPNEAPITFSFSATDANGVQTLTVSAAAFKLNSKGVLVPNTGGAATVSGSSVTITSGGGVGTVWQITAIAVDLCGNTTTTVYTVNVLRPANEGVGNGVDGNTPGHDNNGGNDAPGTSPGNPGAPSKPKK